LTTIPHCQGKNREGEGSHLKFDNAKPEDGKKVYVPLVPKKKGKGSDWPPLWGKREEKIFVAGLAQKRKEKKARCSSLSRGRRE